MDNVYSVEVNFTVSLLKHDYFEFLLHEVELQTSIRTETCFGVLLQLTLLQPFVPRHYMMLIAQYMIAMKPVVILTFV